MDYNPVWISCGFVVYFVSNSQCFRFFAIVFLLKKDIYANCTLKLQDSLIKPVTKTVLGVAVITLLITLAVKERPEWFKSSNLFGGSFPPWILACAVIVFTRMRKRTGDFLKKRGW